MKQLLKYYHKIVLSFIFIFLFTFFCTSVTLAETEVNEELITSQKSSLNIGEFVAQCKKYTSDVFGDTDFNELLNNSIKGDIDNGEIGKTILNILGKETIGAIRTIRPNYYYHSHTFYFKKYE